jgi:hypothetical protein
LSGGCGRQEVNLQLRVACRFSEPFRGSNLFQCLLGSSPENQEPGQIRVSYGFSDFVACSLSKD